MLAMMLATLSLGAPDRGDIEQEMAAAAAQAMSKQIMATVVSPLFVVPLFVLIAYVVLTFERRREGSPTRDDGQLGIKVLLFALLAGAVLAAAAGAEALLAFILGGFKGGWSGVRGSLATVLALGGAAVAVYLLLMPRTNHLEKPQVERLAIGMIAAIAGASALTGANVFVGSLLATAPWGEIAAGLASVGVWGGVAVLAIVRLGSMSGWRSVPRVPQMPMMQPPMMGGQPPQQGMPPLGGGYPPQGGGGWPPQ